MCWTIVSTGEMAMIAYSRILHEQFFTDVTTRRATVCFPKKCYRKIKNSQRNFKIF